MNQAEVNKIITEKVLRKCWHEWEYIGLSAPIKQYLCEKCSGTVSIWDILPSYLNFSQWSDYGPLLEKIQGEKWWRDFYRNLLSYSDEEKLLNPTRGSLALVKFVVEHPEIFGEVK